MDYRTFFQIRYSLISGVKILIFGWKGRAIDNAFLPEHITIVILLLDTDCLSGHQEHYIKKVFKLLLFSLFNILVFYCDFYLLITNYELY